MKTRFKMREVQPQGYQSLMDLDKYLDSTGMSKIERELIKIRASQINGCAYCMNHHIQDAIRYGENPKRIYVLSAWREAINWFNEEEQIILALTEEVTLIANHGVSDEVFDKAVALFGEERTARFIWAIIAINSWNRLGIALNKHPE